MRAEHLLGQRDVGARVVGLNSNRLDDTLLNDNGVPLGPVTTKDGRPIKSHVQHLGELAGRVGKEAELNIPASQ